jgi:hypothetical protein
MVLVVLMLVPRSHTLSTHTLSPLTLSAHYLHFVQAERPSRTKAALTLVAGDSKEKWSREGMAARVNALQTEVEEMAEVGEKWRVVSGKWCVVSAKWCVVVQ